MKRRHFLTTSTATAAATFGFQIVPAHVVRAAPNRIAPNSKIRIAAIGCGGRGGNVLGGMANEDIVALCDVDDSRAAGSFKKFPNAKRFKDFRKMFDTMSDQIDAVLVATPDHTHTVAVLNAIGRDKHVYCEKPLAHTVGEVRAMRDAAIKHKVITQVGNQGHSSDSIRVFCEMVWGGAVGNVTRVNAGCDAFKNVYCQIGKHPDLLTKKNEVPAGLDWKGWLGPSADRPYNPAYLPFNWRGFSAFGSGCIGDWICHVLDPTFWALDLDAPTSVTAEVKGYDPDKDAEYYPAGTKITFEFPAKGDRKAMQFVWHDGDFSIPKPAELGDRRMVGTGAIVIGDKGTIMHGSHGAGGVRIIPEEAHKAFGRPEQKIERVRGGHQADWLTAVRENKQAGSHFEYGGAMSEVGLLGMIAIRFPGETLKWDTKAMKITNNAAANQLVTPEYHNGYTLG